MISAAAVICAAVFVFIYRRRVKKTMDTIEKMLDTAMKALRRNIWSTI